jgi:hypothetical protein
MGMTYDAYKFAFLSLVAIACIIFLVNLSSSSAFVRKDSALPARRHCFLVLLWGPNNN